MKKLLFVMAVSAMAIFTACNKSGNEGNNAQEGQEAAATENVDVNAVLEKGKKLDVKELTVNECLAIAQALTEWSDEGLKALNEANDEATKIESVNATIAAHPNIVFAQRALQILSYNDKEKEAVGITPEQLETVAAALKAYSNYYDAANKAGVSKPLFNLTR